MSKFKVGDHVLFRGGTKAQRRWGGGDPGYHLIIGCRYTVTKVDIRSQHTRLDLKGILGSFNSVLFDPIITEATNDDWMDFWESESEGRDLKNIWKEMDTIEPLTPYTGKKNGTV